MKKNLFRSYKKGEEGVSYERMSGKDKEELESRRDRFLEDLEEDFLHFKMEQAKRSAGSWEEELEMSKEEEAMHEVLRRLRSEQQPRQYFLHAENPYRDATDAYEKGVALYSAGKLEEAVLAFVHPFSFLIYKKAFVGFHFQDLRPNLFFSKLQVRVDSSSKS